MYFYHLCPSLLLTKNVLNRTQKSPLLEFHLSDATSSNSNIPLLTPKALGGGGVEIPLWGFWFITFQVESFSTRNFVTSWYWM